jgi:hypothetical protein
LVAASPRELTETDIRQSPASPGFSLYQGIVALLRRWRRAIFLSLP